MKIKTQSADAKRDRERIFSYRNLNHPRIKSYSNATEELMSVQKW